MNAAGRPLILLVEDSPADANLVEEALSEARLDYGLQVLADGVRAVEYIASVDKGEAPCPDFVLLDLNLPRASGEDVLKRIRVSARCGGVKVLIITSSDAAGDRQRAMDLGANDYFRKPSNWDQFLTLGPKVRQMMG